MFGMAALLPIISELLPMIMPSSISVTKASDVFPPEFLPAPSDTSTENQPNENGNGHTTSSNGDGSNHHQKKNRPRTRNGSGSGSGIKVISRDAIVNKTDKMCATVLIIPPNSSSTIRHNGEQDAIIYAASGTGVLLSAPPEEDLIELPRPKANNSNSKSKPGSKPNGTSPSNPNTHVEKEKETDDLPLPPIQLMDLEAEAEDVSDHHKKQPQRQPKEEQETHLPPPQPVPHPLSQGSFAFVPAWTEHQARNDSPTEPAVWVVVRSGGSPVEVDLTDWGGETAEENGQGGSLLRQLMR